MKERKVCVIGAGLSGISHALDKQANGNDVTVFEKNAEVGGVLQSKNIEGFLLDYGANTLSLRLRKTEEFLKHYEVFEHLVDADKECSKRFIIRGSKVISLPKSPLSFLTSSFLSPLGKLRLCMEPFISRKKDFEKDENMADFVKRRLGNEVLDYAANPFIGGIYASSPETLILKHAFPSLFKMEQKYGSIFLALIRGGTNRLEKLPKTRLVSFKKGMQELPTRLASKLKNPVFLSCKIKKIEKKSEGQWLVFFEDSRGKKKENYFDEIICTIPSHNLGLIEWKDIRRPELLREVAQADHPPLALTFLGFERKQIEHALDGFGFLVPEVEKRKILGTLFSSTLFPNRSPRDHVLLTSFVGGERNPELSKLPKNELIALAFSENQVLLNIRGTPIFEHHKIWPKSIPLPDKSTERRILAAKTLREENQGLNILGAHINGAPLPNCMVPNDPSLFD
mgnify:FL=1